MIFGTKELTCTREGYAHGGFLRSFVVNFYKARGQAHGQTIANLSPLSKRQSTLLLFPPHNCQIAKSPMNLFSSFRAQMVFFVAAIVLLTIGALQLINSQLERRITLAAEEQFNEVNRAIDIALNSFPTGKYLSNLAADENLAVNPQSTIQHIVIVDENNNVFDSTDQSENDNKLSSEIANLPLLRHHESKGYEGNHIGKIQFPITTDKGARTIIVVVSLEGLSQTVTQVARLRLLATGGLGLLLLLITALISRRVTRPITELAQAAKRVTSGDLEFQVDASQHSEIGTLSQTFNDMIAGLRRNRDLEDQLQRAERSAVVGRLASGIAHEIRNPLNFMNLSIDHLRTRFVSPPKSEQDTENIRAEAVNILGLIKDEIARLNRLVSDFLSYGRPAKLKIKEINPRTLLEDVIGIVHAQAEQQGIRIYLQASTADEILLEADAEQLKTCLSNLVINAVQAMPEGGELNIAIAQKNENVEFTLQDTGCGIAADPVEQIFEPYYSTKDTGIGLGLPLTKKLIEDHGGEILVTSEVGKGTTFVVRLPRQALQKALAN